MHTVVFAFNGDTGSASFVIDGSDADDTGNASRVTPTTGTLESGSAAKFSVGINDAVSGLFKFQGQVGFVGYRDAYLTNSTGFMQTDGTPKSLDETTWAEWSGGSVTSPQGRPLFWNPAGDMVNNLGTAGAMTKNGTINVGTGGST